MGGALARSSTFAGGNQYTILDAINAALSNVSGNPVQRPQPSDPTFANQGQGTQAYQPPGTQPGTGGASGKSVDAAGNSTLGMDNNLAGPAGLQGFADRTNRELGYGGKQGTSVYHRAPGPAEWKGF